MRKNKGRDSPKDTPARLGSLRPKCYPEARRLCAGSAPIIFEHRARLPDGLSNCTRKILVWFQDREHVPSAVCRRGCRPPTGVLNTQSLGFLGVALAPPPNAPASARAIAHAFAVLRHVHHLLSLLLCHSVYVRTAMPTDPEATRLARLPSSGSRYPSGA